MPDEMCPRCGQPRKIEIPVPVPQPLMRHDVDFANAVIPAIAGRPSCRSSVYLLGHQNDQLAILRAQDCMGDYFVHQGNPLRFMGQPIYFFPGATAIDGKLILVDGDD